MLEETGKEEDAYNAAVNDTANDSFTNGLPWEVREKVTTISVKPEFQGDIERLLISQFYGRFLIANHGSLLKQEPPMFSVQSNELDVLRYPTYLPMDDTTKILAQD